MATIQTLLSRVHDEFPSVPKQVALRALSDATKEFCTRTHAWQGAIDNIRLRAGQNQYDVETDSGVLVVALKDVRLDGNKVSPLATELDRLRSGAISEDTPVGYIQVSPMAIQVVPTPDADGELQVIAALTLKLGNTTANVSDSVLDEYGEAIASGAKMRLVRRAAQPWYAPDAATGYGAVFYAAITQAKGRTMSALGEAEMRVQVPVI